MKVHEEHKKKAPELVKIALVIVSTSRFEEMQKGKTSTDKTIPLVKEVLKDNPNFLLSKSEIVADSSEQIKNVLNKLLRDQSIDSILFSGGTGLTPKDITYETLEPLLEKKILGFGEFFRYLSFKEIGASAMLSRALAGKLGDKAIFLLPGSPNAVRLALNKLIIPELGHIIYMIKKEE
ncbi:MAG: molybdenum cofactor biosynthesis protein B [Candidatus Hodarchaeota archaeon]